MRLCSCTAPTMWWRRRAPETAAELDRLTEAGFKARIEGTPTLIFRDSETGRELMTGAGETEWLGSQVVGFREGQE